MNPDDKSLAVPDILNQLEALGREDIRRIYRNHGAREPLFGVTTSRMKPLVKQIGRNYPLSMALYATGNYDAMYLAGIIAEPAAMSEADIALWMEQAYCPGLSDYVVAAALAQTPFGQKLADEWIGRPEELYQSAGWSCYGWMLGSLPDAAFDPSKIRGMLESVAHTIHWAPDRVRYAMNGFVIAAGISYLPLHEEAVQAAQQIGPVRVDMGPTSCKVPLASAYIERAQEKGRLGFKRKKMYCL